LPGFPAVPILRRMTYPTLWLKLLHYRSTMIRRGRARRRRRLIRSLGRGVFVYLLVGFALLVMALMW